MPGSERGPLCSSRLGPEWIDAGTSCRSRSGASGPLGFVLSLAMGAAPVKRRTAKERSADMAGDSALFHGAIGVIETSPFGTSKDGKPIVALLYALNAEGKIVYAAPPEGAGEEADGERGSWDGSVLSVSDDFRNSWHKTVVELAHEGTHAWWSSAHKLPEEASAERRMSANVDEETKAQENQLAMYAWMKKEKKMREDALLEIRLERKQKGTLRSTIEARFRGAD